jgi:hypothetical protein
MIYLLTRGRGIRMTTSDFIDELKTVRSLLEWKLVPDTNWTPERRAQPRLQIRATSDDFFSDFLFDPVGALCYVRTGLAYELDFSRVARWLNLPENDAWLIKAAANDLTWQQVGECRRPQPQIQFLRSQLAAAVALEIEAALRTSSPD